jgi:DNA-binding response OmpR family regulator
MAVGTPPASQPPTRARIVVVEDDAAVQDLLDTVLTAAGYTVFRWTQGVGAEAFIRNMQPDLVILDLWLEHPQAGSMVLGLLMVDPATRFIPVLICSAYRQLLGDQEAQLRTHGYLILDKPYQMEDLVAQVHTLLGGTQAHAVEEA